MQQLPSQFSGPEQRMKNLFARGPNIPDLYPMNDNVTDIRNNLDILSNLMT